MFSTKIRLARVSLPCRISSTTSWSKSKPFISLLMHECMEKRWYRGESGEMQSRKSFIDDKDDEIMRRESKFLDIAKPKSEEIYSKHISMPKLENISAGAFDMDVDKDIKDLELDVRKKRLIYRSKQRGWLEVDLLLGTWANENVNGLTMDELNEFEDFVNRETIDIYNIVTLRTEIPDELKGKHGVVERIQSWARQSPLGKADPKKYEEVKGNNNLI